MKKVSMAKQSFKVSRKCSKVFANFKWARGKNIHIYTYTKIKPLYGKMLTHGSYQQGPQPFCPFMRKLKITLMDVSGNTSQAEAHF